MHKIRLALTIVVAVDPEDWANGWEVDVEDVPEDVKEYLEHNLIRPSRVVSDGLLDVDYVDVVVT